MRLSNRKRNASVAVAAAAATLAAVGALAAPASAQTAAPAHAGASLEVTRIAAGAKLHHTFRPHGTGSPRTETLSSPDDITRLGRDIFVNFQNGVGPQGEAAGDGNQDSTIVEFTLTGREVAQWDLHGKSDGLTADRLTGQVLATVNEDANSSLYAINPCTGHVTHYNYSKPLPHKGGTDAIAVYHGQLLISASAPGTTGGTAPSAAFPAVYVTRLVPAKKTAQVSPLYHDEAPAYQANGPQAGKTVKLALVDPDSSEVVPAPAAKYAGAFMLDSQADQELIFDRGGRLTALHLSQAVDDSAWATTAHGALYIPDATDDTVDMVTGTFRVGTMYSSVTPCDAGDAPATCPGPGFPGNYLATANMSTGVLTPVKLSGPALHTKGMIFVP